QLIVFAVLGALVVLGLALALFKLRPNTSSNPPALDFATPALLQDRSVSDQSIPVPSPQATRQGSTALNYTRSEIEGLSIQLADIGTLWRWSLASDKSGKTVGESTTIGDALLTQPRTARAAGDVKLVAEIEENKQRKKLRYRIP
ncbi:hypothetical protein LTR94_026181, partial [Friedmanniomyces endolithicus]